MLWEQFFLLHRRDVLPCSLQESFLAFSCLAQVAFPSFRRILPRYPSWCRSAASLDHHLARHDVVPCSLQESSSQIASKSLVHLPKQQKLGSLFPPAACCFLPQPVASSFPVHSHSIMPRYEDTLSDTFPVLSIMPRSDQSLHSLPRYLQWPFSFHHHSSGLQESSSFLQRQPSCSEQSIGKTSMLWREHTSGYVL